MKGFDAFAGVIKSGSKARRAAKMVVLNADHPDIESFVGCKAKEEKKAHALIHAGYDGSFEGDAYGTIAFQNANNSVRVTDEFMDAASDSSASRSWALRSVADGQPGRRIVARDLLRQIAEATHQCGDPGMQFDTTINDWHTCKASGRINASNPCSEYMFLDDSACNLASINLLKFLKPGGGFDSDGFTDAVDTLIRAQDILVDHASYPTEKIAQNSHEYRPLGLGFANLGALLMTLGIAYDSDAGRSMAAAITSLMTAQAYLTSSELARTLGPFPSYSKNSTSFLEVIRRHQDAAGLVAGPAEIAGEACHLWSLAFTEGDEWGCRNAQLTLLAPTGTIGFMMDCDTTGIEPELALIKYKKLVGGGVMKIVNQSVAAALSRLNGGFTSHEIDSIIEQIHETGTIEGLIEEHYLPIFDCSLRPQNGVRSIHYMGHVRMMAAVQPFLSGAISKTINMPEDSTVDDVMHAYIESWKLGLKAVAIYRDNSKKVQPLNTSATEGKAATPAAEPLPAPVARQSRRPLPVERQAVTRKFSIGGHEGYITVGLYEDGAPGELFVTMAKEGSTISGLIDAFAIAISHCLQYGVPLEFLVAKYKNVRFEPSGWTGDPALPYAKSIVDFIFRWMETRFPKHDEPPAPVWDDIALLTPPAPARPVGLAQSDAPVCSECGGLMVQTGTCQHCSNCDNSTGGCS
jgi:ribonucleoside-diphosphate reductase alpha chain